MKKCYPVLATALLLAILFPQNFVRAAFSGILPVPNAGNNNPVTVTMSSYALTQGQTATVTFTFANPPASFTTSDITASNGTVSNLVVTGNPDVYTATFTPTDAINAPTNTIRVSFPPTATTYTGTGFGSTALAFDGTNMWLTDNASGSITKIGPDGTMITYTQMPGEPEGIAFDGTNMWTTNGITGENSVTEVAPDGTMTTYPLESWPTQNNIAFDGTNMWVANGASIELNVPYDTVTKVAPDGTMTTFTGTGSEPGGIAFDGTNMWTANEGDNSVTKIAPDGTMTTFTGTGRDPVAIAFDGTNMWTANNGDNSVTKVAPDGTMTTFTGTGSQPLGIAFDGTNMWVGNVSNSVTEVAPDGTMVTYPGLGTGSVAFDGANIWTVEGSSSVEKLTLSAGGTSSNYSIDTLAQETLTYTAGPGGSITGPTSQTIDSGANGTPVTAVADPGYTFSNWSDALTANPRTDTDVTQDIAVTANFTAAGGTGGGTSGSGGDTSGGNTSGGTTSGGGTSGGTSGGGTGGGTSGGGTSGGGTTSGGGVVLQYGCKDPSATNYNSADGISPDNTLCTYASTDPVCKDPTASNYSPNGINDSSLCVYNNQPSANIQQPVAHPLVNTDDTTATTSSCPYFTEYLEIGKNNDPVQVTRWQNFLNKLMNARLSVTGVYDMPTFQAVEAFQEMYASDVLAPWGITAPTGYTYKTTRMKASQLVGCPEAPVVLEGTGKTWVLPALPNNQ